MYAYVSSLQDRTARGLSHINTALMGGFAGHDQVGDHGQLRPHLMPTRVQYLLLIKSFFLGTANPLLCITTETPIPHESG
jgi:hypothetical protein